MRRQFTILATIIACAVLLLGSNMVAAQENDPPNHADSSGQQSSGSDEQKASEGYTEAGEGYEAEGRRIGTPTDVDRDLDFSFPKRDYVLPRLVPPKWFQWKEDFYDKYGVKLGFSYQTLYQNASDTLTGNDAAWAGWALIEGRWEMLNRGKDFEGSLTAALDWRHRLGNKAEPASWGNRDVGSLWPTDFAYVDWDPWVPVLYWEQWLKKDVFVFRVGNQIVGQTYDFFRFKDPRVAFSGAPFTAPASSMPFPGPGLAATFEWWPFKGSELYIEGTINDLNAEAEKYAWDDALQEKDFFYGLEIGYFWKRSKADFDHLHLNLFYADERGEPALPGAPNEAGWGFKVLGEKQMGRFVGFGSYTYNTAKGGGFGITAVKHSTTAGLAVLKPFGFRGEIGLGTSWKQPISDKLNSQYGVEAYWKLLLLPNLWVTPGVQVIFDPTFNPQEDTVTIGQIKARLFF